MSTLIRFVTKELNPGLSTRRGIFQKSYDLVNGSDLYEYQRTELRQILDWFNKNLEKPESLSRSRKRWAEEKAISWYRDSALEHIAKMQEMIAILNDAGIPIEMVKTSNPGYVVYQDEFQVVAEHFRETGA